jgi:hypothetical protein
MNTEIEIAYKEAVVKLFDVCQNLWRHWKTHEEP